MHLTCWRGRRGYTTLCAETGGGGRGMRDACVCLLCKRTVFLLGTMETEMEAGSRRKRRSRWRGRCKDSSETKAASPVKEKTGEGGR